MKPNTKCDNCGKLVYKKPYEIKTYKNHFCSRKCHEIYAEWDKSTKIICPCCGKEFIGQKTKRTYCSRTCSNKGRFGIKYSKKSCGNISQKRLNILQDKFNFDSCMVEGCDYNITYDIHRHIPGRDGGEYEVGNMFAICPNCHAEVTRKLCKFVKINDCTLRKVK